MEADVAFDRLIDTVGAVVVVVAVVTAAVVVVPVRVDIVVRMESFDAYLESH